MAKRFLPGIIVLLLAHGCFVEEGSEVYPLRSCYYNSECFWNEFCSDYGWCSLMDGCRVDAECPWGTYCELDGTCQIQHLCIFDYECQFGTFCAADGYCRVAPRCLTALDCPVGHECDPEAGVCYLMVGCQVHNDCDVGYSCGASSVKNVCAFIAACNVNTDCPAGYYCAGGGYCYLNSHCAKDTECAPGTYCDYLGSQRCLPAKNCTVDDANSCLDVVLVERSCANPAEDCYIGGQYISGSYCTADGKCAVPHYCDGLVCRQGSCNSQYQCIPGLICDTAYGVCVNH